MNVTVPSVMTATWMAGRSASAARWALEAIRVLSVATLIHSAAQPRCREAFDVNRLLSQSDAYAIFTALTLPSSY